ncbi:hypothetical protein HanRHA438_Chr13g0583091 [Helianthus annuus]|nr:hypothetical protein HanRHA438_Chr13g0583091 [Helianthus annuus]
MDVNKSIKKPKTKPTTSPSKSSPIKTDIDHQKLKTMNDPITSSCKISSE